MAHHTHESITIVSKSGLFRTGLKSLLSDSAFSIVDEVQSIDQIDGDASGIILVDAGVIPESLVEDIRWITQTYPDRPVVILADVLEWSNLVGTVAAGSSGYLLKDISTDALVGSLNLVMLGEKVFPTHMTTLLLRGVRPATLAAQDQRAMPNLSQRENEILHYLVAGESNKMIARHLDVTEATVKVHMKSLMRKLKCSNRTQAAIWGLNHGFNGAEANEGEDAPTDGDGGGPAGGGNGGARTGAAPRRRALVPDGDGPLSLSSQSI